MSVREVWQVGFNRTVLLLSVVLAAAAGSTATVALQAVGDPTFLYQIWISFVPIVAIFGSCSLISAIVYARSKWGSDPDTVIVVPATLTIFLSCAPVLTLIHYAKFRDGGMSQNWFVFTSILAPIVYTLISDFIHRIVFLYIAPSIWRRDHIWRLVQPQAHHSVHTAHRPKTAASGHAVPHVTKDESWYDLTCLSIWISGVSSSLMSIRELWAIVFSKTIMMLSMLIGTAAAVASAVTLKAVGDDTYLYLALFAVAPVFVNIGSASLMSVWVYLRVQFRSEGSVPTVSIPSCLTIYLAALPAISAIYFLKLMAGGLGREWLVYVLTIAPFFYVVISDFFHYIVFTFIAPSIWQRPHTHSSEAAAEQAQPKPEIVALKPAKTVTIGNTSFVETDLVFLEAQGNYLRIVTKTSEGLERFRISSAVDRLSSDLGLFVHRSYWVAYRGIDQVSVARGKCLLHTLGGEVITVASTRQEKVIAALETRKLITS